MAVDALVAGIDSPSLRRLAGEPSGVPYLAPLFESALDELGLGDVDLQQAAFILARDVAGHIVSGKLSEVDGAGRIYEDVYRRLPLGRAPDYLWEFVSAYSTIRDCEFNVEDGGSPAPELIESEKLRIRRAAVALSNACSAAEFRLT